MSRDPEMFIKPELIPAFKERCKQAGIVVMITRVDATELEQMALYAQGRESLEAVNIKRNIADMAPIKEKQNRKVTWTLNSKHIPVIVRLDDKGNPVKKSRAFDFAVVKDGIPTWLSKIDVDLDGEADYLECGIIGESLGLQWGGRWKDSEGKPNPDFPHLQWRTQR